MKTVHLSASDITILATPIDPDDTPSYLVDWSYFLSPRNDTLASQVVTGENVTATDGGVQSGALTTIVDLSGGVLGATATVTMVGTTSAGKSFTRRFKVRVQER